MLGLPPGRRRPRAASRPVQPGRRSRRGSYQALAAELASRLDTAVLGMRFPVADDFAVSLSAVLYDLLLGREQPLPGALGLALPKVVTKDAHALPAATAMSGGRALDLVLRAPRGEPVRLTRGKPASWPASGPSRSGSWAGLASWRRRALSWRRAAVRPASCCTACRGWGRPRALPN